MNKHSRQGSAKTDLKLFLGSQSTLSLDPSNSLQTSAVGVLAAFFPQCKLSLDSGFYRSSFCFDGSSSSSLSPLRARVSKSDPSWYLSTFKQRTRHVFCAINIYYKLCDTVRQARGGGVGGVCINFWLHQSLGLWSRARVQTIRIGLFDE